MTAETNVTPVREGEDAKYELVGFKCTLSDGNGYRSVGEQVLQIGNSYTFQMTVEAGNRIHLCLFIIRLSLYIIWMVRAWKTVRIWRQEM